ncbi:hypothetical protein QJS10_CPB17g00784 [Acorus calamus]|uniref:Uncharacterized protein n=1 Tax=Acorus calamus TaxID=4465 RepID=A0AAV9CTV4_ACOCL|nr:hypothetical protein QJS10_CPB17g00784 [Acorus calamus]
MVGEGPLPITGTETIIDGEAMEPATAAVKISELEPDEATELARRLEFDPDDPLGPHERTLDPLGEGLLPGELVAPQEQLPLLEVAVIGQR